MGYVYLLTSLELMTIFLCTNSIMLERLDINYMSYPRYDTEKINSLVAPEDFRILLKAVAKSFEQESLDHQNSTYPSPLNFIQRKGQGKIILLHGPPGVGKTYSASKHINTILNLL
jgi:DNA replication protein DnaC